MYFDSHAHLDDERFDGDREQVAENISERNISGVMNVCSSVKNIDICLNLVQSYDSIYAAFGIHPHEAVLADDETLNMIVNATKHHKVKAYGEIGLDYYYDFSPRDIQKKIFEAQIGIAHDLKLPIIIHNRDSHKDMIDILTNAKDKIIGGVMHMYSGSWDMAKKLLDLGMYISLGGPVTFKNAVTPLEIAEKVPIDRLLIETDCPYMSPHPLRGRRNHPGNVAIVAQRIAETRGVSVDEVAHATTKNAIELFRL